MSDFKLTRRDHCTMCGQSSAEIARLRAEVERLTLERDEERLERGRQECRATLFMQFLAWASRERRLPREEIMRWKERFDEAGEDVRLEDFVHAHPNGAALEADR